MLSSFRVEDLHSEEFPRSDDLCEDCPKWGHISASEGVGLCPDKRHSCNEMPRPDLPRRHGFSRTSLAKRILFGSIWLTPQAFVLPPVFFQKASRRVQCLSCCGQATPHEIAEIRRAHLENAFDRDRHCPN